ncbi:MAG: universal stress protein [Bacteroidales bacterium]|nr:universal stress protein [Bacteroidales bacterium]
MNEKFLTLATLTQMRAQLLSAMLEEQGIESFMTHQNEIKEAAGGVDVMVGSEDFLTASQIYEDFKSAYGKEKEQAVNYMRIARRILVPVDFTEHAENAACYALRLASVMKADVQLLNVYMDPNQSPFVHMETFTFAVNLEEITQEIENQVEQNLKALQQKLKAKLKANNVKGVNVFYDLVKGNVVNTILDYAEAYNPGLLVMGTRGSKREGRWSFGSVTAKVIEKITRPIIAVPKGFDSEQCVLPQRIAYATDFDETDYWALSKLASFAKPFDARIHCLHISEMIENLQEVQMHKMKQFITEKLGVQKLECGLLECIDLQLCLEDFVKENNIDIIAMTTHHRNLFMKLYHPSVTRKVLYHSEIPLMVFHSLSSQK